MWFYNMVIFKEKNFGLLEGTWKGAAIGTAVGGGMVRFLGKKGKKDGDSKTLDINTPSYKFKEKEVLKSRKVTLDTQTGALAGAIIGAALGFLASAIKDTANYINKKRTVNDRLLPDVVKRLEKMGHKQDMSFTLDPKRADMMKAKVSLVVYKYSDDLRLIVNTVDDHKLAAIMKQVTEKIARSTTSAYREEISGKFRDLKITAISDSSTDADYIAWVASNFINNGYPVYLVEVG